MNDGLLYIYDGPPVISGDPCCSKCRGTEFRWEGKCVKCVDKEIDRWEELKRRLVEYKKFERDDYGRGWNHAVNFGLKIMKELEEK